ncbi:TPA: hypothetical protein QCX48_005576 [Bacillus mycoides]|uniref:hypothetical protein n=1 Tax=Bacillus TaxID=1386 RepID=UPI000A3C103E|nr:MULTISPECIES: hypothetical protein [Bacillus cereus group]UKS62296.1 hypothetical protein K6T24_10530 [Bacillus toyonensis]HDR7588506.1 hypothetical protein [Bacillus mycoides]HDR7590623.1 hypothetical protein [Bacillus mycoides]
MDIYELPNGAKNELDIIEKTIQSHILDLISRAIHTFREKIDDILQKSKSEITSYSESIPDSVLISATHELKLKSYSIKNRNRWLSYSIFDNLNNYPLDTINSFFNHIRITNDILVGYS